MNLSTSKSYMILLTMMLVGLLSTAGIALPYPILAPLFLDPAYSPLTSFAGLHPKILLAIVLAVYPLGLLLGSSFIGALSDIYGRKRTLLITLLISVLGYLLTAVALSMENFAMFVLARFITGVFEGNLPIARAIAADLHPQVDKTRSFSWMLSTNFAGWLVGPLLGGYLMVYSPELAFYVAGLAILLAALAVWWLIPSTLDKAERRTASLWRAAVKHNSFRLLSRPTLKQVFAIQLLLALGLNAFYEFYPLWLVDKLAFDSVAIGHSTALLTIVMVFTGFALVEFARHRFGKIRVTLSSLFLLSIAFMAIPWVDEHSLLVYFALIGALIAFYSGLLPVYISDRYEDIGQGKLMGLLSTTFYFANVLIALGGGLLSLAGAQWSVVFGGILMMCGAIYLLYFDQTVPPKWAEQHGCNGNLSGQNELSR